MGKWIDDLGTKTASGEWQIFGTITYATRNYPWRRGFPISGNGRPHPDFAHNFFTRLVNHLESDLRTRVDYVVADQFGEIGGRFHQHAILAACGLDRYSRTELWKWVREKAGWNRMLPFERGAAFYISRYIGRDAHKCDWNFRIGEVDSSLTIPKPAPGKTVLVQSAPVEKAFYHAGLHRRKR
jgi:hypothetical protein